MINMACMCVCLCFSVLSLRTCLHGSFTTWLHCIGVSREKPPALLSASEGLCSSAPGEEWGGGGGGGGAEEEEGEWCRKSGERWKKGGEG